MYHNGIYDKELDLTKKQIKKIILKTNIPIYRLRRT